MRQYVNVGAATLQPGQAVKFAIGYFSLAASLAAGAALNRTTFASQPAGSRGRYRVTVGSGAAACTVTVTSTSRGIGNRRSETLNVPMSGGVLYTAAGAPHGQIAKLISSADVGDLVSLDLEILGIAAAGVNDAKIAGVFAGGVAVAQWGLAQVAEDGLLDASTTPPGVLCASNLSVVYGAELVVGTSGLGRMYSAGDAGDAVGVAVGAAVITINASSYCPIRVRPRPQSLPLSGEQ